MHECEVLCSKLVVMSNGVIQCIGSSQYIKNKYCKELNLTIKCKRASSQATNDDIPIDVVLLEDFIFKNVPNSMVNFRQQETLFVQVDNRDFRLDYLRRQTISDLFFILDSIKFRFNIETFTISEPTLEQVFFLLTEKDTWFILVYLIWRHF